MGEKRREYTCDSSETRRIKRIHRGNVNMHHRLDRIPVRIIPFLFRRCPIHSRRISFSVPLSAFFISLCVTCTRPRWSHLLLHLRFLLRPTRAPLLSRQTSPPSVVTKQLSSRYTQKFFPFSPVYIYIRFTFLSVSFSNITRGYDPYVAMPPLISNITPIRERHLCDVSIESICCYRCHVMEATRVCKV